MRSVKYSLFILLLFSSLLRAQSSPSVTDWTQAALLDTLAASYADTPADIAEAQAYFLPSAWRPMLGFLRDKRTLINEQQLVLHPGALNAPTVLADGYCDPVRCWTISQSFTIPELRLNLVVVAVVIPATGKNPFAIQSLNMRLQNY